jgi:hypothetical protein
MQKRLRFILAGIAIYCSLAPMAMAQDKPGLQFTRISEDVFSFKNFIINQKARSITIKAVIADPNMPLEVILCRPEGKAYESLLNADITPAELQALLILLGYESLNRTDAGNKLPPDTLGLFVEWKDSLSVMHHETLESLVLDQHTGKCIARSPWIFQGLYMDREGKIHDKAYLSIISNYYDVTSIIQLATEMNQNGESLAPFLKPFGLRPGMEVSLVIAPFRAQP